MNQTNSALILREKYNLSEAKSILEQGFLYDWAISIEYAHKIHQNYNNWTRWDKTFFAIKNSDQVLSEILACCKSNPECSMKLVCERFNPECRLIYCMNRNKAEILNPK